MGQWGQKITLIKDDTCIQVSAHVDTGGAFTPLFDSSSGVRMAVGVIDHVILDSWDGDLAAAEAMMEDLKRKYVGMGYEEWLKLAARSRAMPYSKKVDQ